MHCLSTRRALVSHAIGLHCEQGRCCHLARACFPINILFRSLPRMVFSCYNWSRSSQSLRVRGTTWRDENWSMSRISLIRRQSRLPSNSFLERRKARFGRFPRSGLRYVSLSGGTTLIEQNPSKQSRWAQQARQGHQIAWLMKEGRYLARVFDGEVTLLVPQSDDVF